MGNFKSSYENLLHHYISGPPSKDANISDMTLKELKKYRFYFTTQQFNTEFLHANSRFQSNAQEADLSEGVFYTS